MEALLALLEQSSPATWLRVSRWGYAVVNTLHVLGIALLVGAILPLDLRLMGRARELSLLPLTRLLQRVAVAGLLLALATGACLFAVRATEYAAEPLFALKLGLVALALGNALILNLGPGVVHASPRHRWLAGGLSLALWPSVLVAGRFLAFVAD